MSTQRWKFRLITILCVTALISLVGIGCSDDDIPSVDTSTYYGLGTDHLTSFVINLEGTSFDAATSGQTLGGDCDIALDGTVTPAGGKEVTVQGCQSGSTFAFSGGGYNLFGTVTGNTVQGGGTTPNGDGSFVLFIGGAPESVTLYCGTGTCTVGTCTGSAHISLAVSGTTAVLTANLEDGPVALSNGVATSTSVSFDQTVLDNHVMVTGTIGAGVITDGLWSTDNGNPKDNPDRAGTWNASTAECTTAPTFRR